MEFLRELVVIFAVAVAVVTLLSRLRVPSVAGFILAGVVVGPSGLRLVADTAKVEVLAEVGVILLLFGIGLELSLPRLRRSWKPIAIGGALQVALTILASAGVARLFGLSLAGSVVIGFIVSTSSTAIVLRALEERAEADAPHGRLTIGILVFQDLCVVPMMLAIPIFGGAKETTWAIAGTLATTLALLLGVFLVAYVVAPRVLHLAARTRRRDLFVLVVFLICLGTAWAASSAGVSLALGAFLAGLVVASSDYRSQALADLIPFREVLSSLFFISVGMLLSPAAVGHNAGVVIGMLALIIAGKVVLVFLTGVIMRLPLRVSILSAAALAQVGEFAFVLARPAQQLHMADSQLLDNLMSAAILSMIIAPVVLALGPRLAAGVGRLKPLTRFLDVRPAEDAREHTSDLSDHVIIAGWGVTGQELAIALKTHRVPFVIVDLNVDNVHDAVMQGEPAFFGDVTNAEVLSHLGLERAKEFVLAINDPSAAERAVRAVRNLEPALHILVRSRYLGDVGLLKRAGASRVIPAEIEAAAEVVAHVLARHQIARQDVQPHLDRVRRREEEAEGGR